MKLNEGLREAALGYHEFPTPGKLSVTPTKQLVNQRDLALAYSPGVAAACEEIVEDPKNASRYTARGNLVAVITNGTAVLGLGDIGPLAAKPVMEGKGVLFKKFSGIDVFDIEINESDPDKLRERLNIPVFHDDQHGTAIIVAAGTVNALSVVGKDISQIKLVVSGAGAAALACVDLLIDLGLPKENIWLTDRKGVIHSGRAESLDESKARFAQDTDARTLAEIMKGADMFLGLSSAGVVDGDMVASMADKPIIFALANPIPEILPEDVRKVRDDAIIATGRTDYPNQVNNVLCFPFIFRGALDVGATTITREMEIATVHAIADLARMEQNDIVASAYGLSDVQFGPEYLIPSPFDPRLLVQISPAVAKAAMDSGVATRPIEDFKAYREQLQRFTTHSGALMKPVLDSARNAPAERKRIVLAEGEEERMLRAAQVLVDEDLAYPILIGRPASIEKRIKRLGLRLKPGKDCEIVNTEFDDRHSEYWREYHGLMSRRGVTEQY